MVKASFRQALAWAGVSMLAALVVMGLVTALGLSRADRLIDRVGESQDQLARLTRIEADTNALLAGLSGALSDGVDPTRAAGDIERQLADYRASVADEARSIGRRGQAAQATELQDAQTLTRLFEPLKSDLLSPFPSPGSPEQARLRDDLARFYRLAQAVEAREREEGAVAAADMRRLRRTATWIGVAIPLGVAVLGGAAAWLMLAGVVRPLRVLEAAADRAGRGGGPEPVAAQGFAEFERLADAFTRMDREIAAQRQALFDANEGLEAQVAARTARLAEIDRTRRLFFSKVSHELRTPATVVRGEAEVALRDPAAPAERLREALAHVAANGEFLQRRLDDLLALARAEDGRISLRRDLIDLAELTRKVAGLAEPYARSSGAALELDLAGEPPPLVRGDESWLQQAVLALVDNAAKYAGDGPIRLSLTRNGGAARLAVSDGGPGVDAADLPRLFDSFYQAPSSPQRGGAGLGLAVARWVAEQHGGDIAAQNIPGSGLVVEISLPLAA
jgi:signal transduction histidine kinase